MKNQVNKILLITQIKAAIAGQDQLVFAYKKNDNDTVVRFVTPLEIMPSAKPDEEIDFNDIKVLCVQHLPQEAYRHFFLHKIESFHRVISRNVFSVSTLLKSDDTGDTGEIQDIGTS